MRDLGDHLVHAITGRWPDAQLDWRDMMGDLQRKAGRRGQTGAAEAAGIPRRTWRDIASGATRRPKPATIARIESGWRRSTLRPGVPDADVVVKVSARGEDRSRALRGSQLDLRQGTMRKVAQTWVTTGSKDQVILVFLAGVQDTWYRAALTPRRYPHEQKRGDPPRSYIVPPVGSVITTAMAIDDVDEDYRFDVDGISA